MGVCLPYTSWREQHRPIINSCLPGLILLLHSMIQYESTLRIFVTRLSLSPTTLLSALSSLQNRSIWIVYRKHLTLNSTVSLRRYRPHRNWSHQGLGLRAAKCQVQGWVIYSENRSWLRQVRWIKTEQITPERESSLVDADVTEINQTLLLFGVAYWTSLSTSLDAYLAHVVILGR